MRQGQTVKGMVTVRVIGVLLVTCACAVMLALQPQPAVLTEQSRQTAVAATQQDGSATPDPPAAQVN